MKKRLVVSILSLVVLLSSIIPVSPLQPSKANASTVYCSVYGSQHYAHSIGWVHATYSGSTYQMGWYKCDCGAEVLADGRPEWMDTQYASSAYMGYYSFNFKITSETSAPLFSGLKTYNGVVYTMYVDMGGTIDHWYFYTNN